MKWNFNYCMINHILIPYDKSDQAIRAFTYAKDLAKKYNSSVTIISCIPIQIPTDLYYGATYIETTKLLKEAAAKSLAGVETELKESKIPFKSEVLEVTSITDSLISYAESHNVDLIVIGSRGIGGFKKLLLGSVASGVSQHSQCPVLIIK